MDNAIPRLAAPRLTIAAHQKEYRTVVGALVDNPRYGGRHPNTVALCYALNDEERARIADGADIYICFLTGGGALQPHNVIIGAEETAALYNVGLES